MEDHEIDILSQSENLGELSDILTKFLKYNENSFNLLHFSGNNKREILWAALFQLLQKKSLIDVHAACLASIRVLSRDKTDLEKIICEKWITILIETAGLYNLVGLDEEVMVSTEVNNKDIVIESLKCLCNLVFNSDITRAICAHTTIAHGLVGRLRMYKDIPDKEEIMLYDMKLLFILTALRYDIKNKVKQELHGMDYLMSCMKELILEAFKGTNSNETASMDTDGSPCFIDDKYQLILCEMLKIMFTLNVHLGPEEPVDEAEEAMYLTLIPILSTLLCANASSQDNLMELRSNIANLLTGVPQTFYSGLTPELKDGEAASYVYESRNMEPLQALLVLLQHRLKETTNTTSQYERLSPTLTALNKAARGSRAQRKFLRGAVLPPLRDASAPPERGAALRNQLCRLLTTPVAAVRDLVAELLFTLCKENVGRMVKYTGFGNAAGHLAQKGLLGGGHSGAVYSSSSDDSDTEEYLEAQPHIDPVVGCTRPPRVDPFEGMTEEQKEYEAMKLVNLFDKMLSSGVVRPARAGADGRPQPVEHVLQLREQLPQ